MGRASRFNGFALIQEPETIQLCKKCVHKVFVVNNIGARGKGITFCKKCRAKFHIGVPSDRPRLDEWQSLGTYRRKAPSDKRREWLVYEHKKNPRCDFCNEHTKLIAPISDPLFATVDHILPRAFKGVDQPHNYALACTECNSLKADAPDIKPIRWRSIKWRSIPT